jgi:capsule biosynthesis phosphatase
MINESNVIVMDIDGTLCHEKSSDIEYSDLSPRDEVLKTLHLYRLKGFYIILNTARQMRTYQGNIGKINANTAKVLFEWLDKHNVPYDEILFGKPWCGKGGFYVDDKTVRPDEFVKLNYEEIIALLNERKV